MRGAWEAYAEYLSELCTKRIGLSYWKALSLQVGCNGSTRYRAGVLGDYRWTAYCRYA
ncbi:MAG: hypothetical protein HDR01_11740 [Lachnospiraceae bacterium]|nr:hypothetical protein [Lachnospiraceae bacterium]